MKKAYKLAFFLAVFPLLLIAITTKVIADNSGSVFVVSHCSQTQDNHFNVGENVKGRGNNFDDNTNYRWTIKKNDEPNKYFQVASGDFYLNNNQEKFCFDLWVANIISGDQHSEFKWEVFEFSHGQWKKVDSDNFTVHNQVVTATVSPTRIPTVTLIPNSPTNSPTPTQVVTTTPTDIPSPTPWHECGEDCPVTPTSTVTESPTLTLTPTLSPVPTAGPSGTLTVTPLPTVQPTNPPSNDNNGSVAGASTQSVTKRGQVLGASTLAANGTFTETLGNLLTIIGLLLTSISGVIYAKAKKI